MNHEKDFFISGYLMPPRTDEAFSDLKAAGLNHIYIDYTEREQVRSEAFSLCDRWGIGAIVMTCWSRHDQPSFARVTAGVAGHPSFVGVNGLDEPLYEELDGIEREYDAFHARFPDKAFYVNMVNRGVPHEFVSKQEGITHADLMSRYAQLVGRMQGNRTVSMTVYPLMHDESGRSFLNENHLLSLRDLAECAQKCAAEMYFFVQTMPFRTTHRKPEEADIRFQVACGLAFGARGVQYFCYRTPDPNWEFSQTQYAMILADGTRTDIYDSVARVNRELRAMAEDYLRLTYCSTYGLRGRFARHTPKAFDRFFEDRGLPAGMTSFRSTQDTLAGEFSDGDAAAYYLVNYTDPAERQDSYLEFSLENCDSCSVQIRGKKSRIRPVQGKFCLLLKPGEGALVTRS